MSVKEWLSYEISCDECAEVDDGPENFTIEEAEFRARSKGWRVVKETACCPSCLLVVAA